MIRFLRTLVRNLPTLLLAFGLAVAVWISAETSADPNISQPFLHTINIQIIGQDPGYIIVSDSASQVSVVLNAPQSRWTILNSDPNLVTATVDISGLGPGTHTVPIKLDTDNVHPVDIVSQTPLTMTLTIEALTTKSFPVTIVTDGEPAIGYQAGTPSLNVKNATVSGPQPLVQRVTQVQALLNLTDANKQISSTVELQAVDETDTPVNGLTINPPEVTLTVPVTQLGGYRDVVVKAVMSGQVANGYRLTNISVTPPTVTVYSSNPQLVNNLPGFVETTPIDITGAKSDLDLRTPLNLPEGISVVGEQTVLVQIGIAPIESSLTLSNMKVDVVGLDPTLSAKISPQTVVVIISGPLPLLDTLSQSDVHVYVDLAGKEAGTFQIAPQADINVQDLRVDSILPATLEVTISPAATPTPAATTVK
jgi:YbbR domain-containing protein